ncbi:hypothetical protein [Streptomyces rimosus]|uniref:hypothetical protein n=1 Tax=Streptomyces rimosus TaxID=1927 RepID=UPI000ABE89B0|nr:hypothetical protein [Streptomyces rimosus]
MNCTQQDSEDHYWAVLATLEPQDHMVQAATIATDVRSRLLTVASHPPQAGTGLG